MKYKLLLLTLSTLLFISCGENNKSIPDNSPKIEIKDLDKNTTALPTINHNAKSLTIYVHGYRKKGYKKDGLYGNLHSNTFKRNLIKYTDSLDFNDYDKGAFPFERLVASVEFYGDKPTTYYTEADIEEINKLTETYGGGIPKYALVTAKFIKYALKKSGLKRVNIVSASMGSLVTRWMIEKNLEELASTGTIEKWMTVQGVIRGNYALSKVSEGSFLNLFFEPSIDTDHMKYKWIKENLTAQPSILKSPYYGNMLVGQISLTNGTKKDSLLKYALPFYGGFQPNDGVQLLKDTYFQSVDSNNSQVLTHTIIYHDHIDVKNSESTFVNINSFLEAKKRIRVTLLDATVKDIHEKIDKDNVGSEIVFDSKIYSSIAQERWELEKPIDERLFKSGALKVYNYPQNDEKQTLNQILFDNFVSEDEESLTIKIGGYEIDNSSNYHIRERSNSRVDSLGESEDEIELKDGIYAVSAKDWSGHIKVEVIEF